MLISCTSCNSKYLVNSLDLKPNGRIVQCAKCGNQWHQNSSINDKSRLEDEIISSFSSPDLNNQKGNSESQITNLPSTYVRESKVSILNSIFVVLFIIFLIGGFWIFRNLEINSFVLFKFYWNEFTFNLKLIFIDIAKIIHQLIN